MSAVENLFFYILLYSFLLPVLSFIVFLNKLRFKRVAIVITSYSLIIFLFLFFDDFLSHYKKIYATFYTTVEYSCFSYIIGQVIQNRTFRKIILFLSLIFILFEALYFYMGNFHRIDSVPIGIETILILIYTFYLFYEQFQTLENVYIYNNYWFWLVIGILFYLGSSFFFNILANRYLETAQKWWFLTWIFETIKNVLFVVGITYLSKKQSDNDKNSASIPYLDMML
jgi:hypothetical protein